MSGMAGIDRQDITLLLKKIIGDIVDELNNRAVYTFGQESGALTEVALAMDSVSVEYHVSQIDEYVREADEDSS